MRALDVLHDFFSRYSEPEQDALIEVVDVDFGCFLARLQAQIRGGAPVRQACQAALYPDSQNAPAVREREVKARV